MATAPARASRPSTRQQSATTAGRPAADPSKLSVNRAAPDVNPKLDAAWRAYNQGDLQSARLNYGEMLREEPSNRDALLGMAALEVRASRPELAEPYYRKLLEANPRDPHAQAGLLSLHAQTTDPVQAESRVKSLIANDPEAQVLYFTLGNQYAQQGRWPEAQQAYFRAFSADPENPDFAYNLAVSLDQVKQPKQALEYYRRAIALAQQRSSNFDQALARNRVQELAR
jgi:tetratricopeptide (TPR) repeat protein